MPFAIDTVISNLQLELVINVQFLNIFVIYYQNFAV